MAIGRHCGVDADRGPRVGVVADAGHRGLASAVWMQCSQLPQSALDGSTQIWAGRRGRGTVVLGA
jgi:hypothetical protein